MIFQTLNGHLEGSFTYTVHIQGVLWILPGTFYHVDIACKNLQFVK